MHNPTELGTEKDDKGLYIEALKNMEGTTDVEKKARLYACTVVLGHLERQINASYDNKDQYRRREQIRLQIARAKFKMLMSDYYKSEGLPSPHE
jgi:hypothetical protein|tara:strand:+ start:989 stop:1270 length:282 start_codon:yes stop_codon:yes gene_type:complete